MIKRIVRDIKDPERELKVVLQPEDRKVVLRIGSPTSWQEQEVDLPEDAYTLLAKARYEHGTLTVTMPRRDPQGETMLEYKLLGPDRKPRELDIEFPHKRHAPPCATCMHAPCRCDARPPAIVELGEHNTELLGEPVHKYAHLPSSHMDSSVVTDNPVLVDKGGAMETPSLGETVVRVPGSADTKVATDEQEGVGKGQLTADELAQRMHGLGVVGAHTVVLEGMREKELDEEYGQAQDEEQEVEHVSIDFTKEKVGLATRPLDARDAYVTSESRDQGEPISSLYSGDERCELCECNPCQCDKVDASRVPYEVTKQEQKRMGKPHMKHTAKPVTGKNAHDARDYRMHAKPRSEQHAGVGQRLADYEGNVPMGSGDWKDYTPDKYHKIDKGASHTGGQEIKRDELEGHHVHGLG